MVRSELLEAIENAPLLQAYEDGLNIAEGPSEVRAATSQDLGRLLTEVETELGWNLGPYRIPSMVGHEVQHARVAKERGASKIDFLVRFMRIPTIANPDGFVHVAPLTRPQFPRALSRLELALIAAYPSCPSDSDMAAVRQLGYEDIDQVAECARDINRDFGAGLPVPLWAREPGWTRLSGQG